MIPAYAYKCRSGHETLIVRGMNNAKPKTVTCVKCRRVSYRNYSIQAQPDITEHFNTSLGEPVRSRRHLRDLQQKYGCQSYEPVRDRDAGLHEAWKVTQQKETA